MSRLFALLALLAAAPALGQPVFLQQLTSPDPVTTSRFGSAVALSGDFIVVGEPGEEGAIGRAFVYFRAPGSGTWDLDAELTPNSLEEGGEFDPALGTAVAFDGPTALVGAPYESGEVVNSGAAYIFRQDEETDDWINFAKLKAPEPALEDQFGTAVALSGANAAVGAMTDDEAGENAGAVYLFTRDVESGSWMFDQQLTADDAEMGDRFGFSVALAEDVLVVGVSNEIGADDPGVVYVFERDGEMPWQQVQQLVPDDIEEGDNLGFAVATDGTTIFIGAPLSGPTEQGSAYVYERTGSGDTPWQLAQRLVSNAPQDNAQFGAALSVEDDRAVVGAPLDGTDESSGAVYSFERVGDVWSPTGRLSAESTNEGARFGLNVDLNSGITVVGSPGADGDVENAGAAYIFSLLPTAAEGDTSPDAFALEAPFPNPAPAATSFVYTLDASTAVSLIAYDVLGREVAVLERGVQAAGRHTVRWTTQDLRPGVYLVRLTDGEHTATRKLVVL